MADQTHVSTMQLFYELKQKFPAVPDFIVSECIKKNQNDKGRCEEQLVRANEHYTHIQGAGQAAKMYASSGGGGGVSGAAGAGGGGGGGGDTHLAHDIHNLSLGRLPAPPPLQFPTSSHQAGSSLQYPTTLQPAPFQHFLGGPGLLPLPPSSQAGAQQFSAGSQFPLGPPHPHYLPVQWPRPATVSSVDEAHHHHQQSSVSMYVSSGYHATQSAPTTPQVHPQPIPHPEETRFDPVRNMHYNVHNYELNVNYRLRSSLPVLPPPPPPPPPPSPPPPKSKRRTTELKVDQQGFWGIDPPPQAPNRPYTSVNLTLRPPSTERQPPIDIKSASSSSSLTYSTSSCNPDQGYQSRFQIEIGPSGGCISAVRTRMPGFPPPSPVAPSASLVRKMQRPRSHYQGDEPVRSERKSSLPDVRGTHFEAEDPAASRVPQMPVLPHSTPTTPTRARSKGSTEQGELAYTQALLLHQLDRKRKLEEELDQERDKLRRLETEVRTMELELYLKRHRLHNQNMLPWVKELQKLREDNRKLRVQCECMAHEVDLHDNGRVPLCETSEEFYKNINTGQEGPVLLSQPSAETPHTPASNFVDPGGGVGGKTGDEEEEGISEEGPQWTCSMCTFHNHPALDKCEQCDMPRIMLDRNL